jgi:hypothetical protein
MISIEDRGSTRSGRVYLPNFIDRVPDSRRLEVIQNLANSRVVDVNSLSTMMENLSIRAKTAGPSKALGEYGIPSTLVAKNPIVYPDVKGIEYEIVIHLKRIYNFLCSMLVYTNCYMFCLHFPAFLRIFGK